MQYVAILRNFVGEDTHVFESDTPEEAQTQAQETAKGYGAKLESLFNYPEYINHLYDQIQKTLFTTEALLDYDELTDAFIELASTIHTYSGDNDDWIFLGGGNECGLSDLLVAAYWHFAEWHQGQCSETFKAFCVIAQVYQPGMSSGVEEDSPEEFAFKQLADLAQEEITHG